MICWADFSQIKVLINMLVKTMIWMMRTLQINLKNKGVNCKLLYLGCTLQAT